MVILQPMRHQSSARCSPGLGTRLLGKPREAELLHHGRMILVITEVVNLALAEMGDPTETYLDFSASWCMLNERTWQGTRVGAPPYALNNLPITSSHLIDHLDCGIWKGGQPELGELAAAISSVENLTGRGIQQFHVIRHEGIDAVYIARVLEFKE